jgi:exopolysaccharide production protein ExoZ
MFNKNINSLQALRAFAAILVMLYHTAKQYSRKDGSFLFGIFDLGYSGVDIFFVLSGFVISLSVFSKLNQPKSAVSFFLVRLARIYPAYWLLLFVPLSLLFFINADLLPNKTPFLSYAWVDSFFLLFGHSQITQITWTLSFEIYFYLLFTLFIINKNFYKLLFLILPIAFINIFYKLNWLGDVLNKYLLSPLIIEFFLGSLAALLVLKRKEIINSKNGMIIAISGVLLFSMSNVSNFKPELVRELRVLYFGLPAFLMVLGFAYSELLGGLRVSNNLIVKTGDASYALYLIHSPIVSFGNAYFMRLDEVASQIASISLCLIIILTSLYIHKFIEWPIYMKLKKGIAKINQLKINS